MKFITSPEQLSDVFDTTHEVAIRKELAGIDHHSRRFIERSPSVFIGSQDGNGNADVSPKGDLPGFVQVLDDKTLAVPDRPGNNRLDTWKNIIENPAVGLIFLIPGMNETLRINGEARLTTDPDLCAQMHVNNRPALAVMVVKVRQVYMHCAKAFIRSKLWSPETWPDRKEMPTLGEILKDQAELSATAREFDVLLDDAYQKTLW
jgi:hypothetical protein